MSTLVGRPARVDEHDRHDRHRRTPVEQYSRRIALGLTKTGRVISPTGWSFYRIGTGGADR